MTDIRDLLSLGSLALVERQKKKQGTLLSLAVVFILVALFTLCMKINTKANEMSQAATKIHSGLSIM